MTGASQTVDPDRALALAMEDSSQTLHRISASVAVRTGGRVVTAALGAGYLVILTRTLGEAAFGDFVTGTTVIALAAVVADGGVVAIGVRESVRSARVGQLDRLASLVTLARLAASLVVSLVMVVVVRFTYQGSSASSVRLVTAILSVSLVVNAFGSGFQMMAEAEIRVASLVCADVVGRAVSLAGAAVAIATHRGLGAICWSVVAGGGAGVLVLWATRRGAFPLRRGAGAEAWVIWRGAVPLGLALVLNAVYFRVDTVMISLMRPASEVGAYGVAYRMLEIVLSVGAFVLTALLPVFSAAAGSGDDWKRVADRAFRFLLGLGLVVAGCGAIVAHRLVAMLSGSGYSGAGSALEVLLLAGALSWVNGCGGTMLISIDKQRDALWLNVIALVVNVGLNLVLIPRYGFIAAAWTTVGCELVNFAGMIWLLRREGGYRWRRAGWSGVFGLAAASALATAALQGAGLPTLVVVAVVGTVWTFIAVRLDIVPLGRPSAGGQA